jgi:drug/metabolite transporter (DMT)-like permease
VRADIPPAQDRRARLDRPPGAPGAAPPLGAYGLVVVIGLLQTAAVMGLLFVAMRSIPASTAAILLFTNPIWVAVLGHLFLGETLRGEGIVGLGVGVVGAHLAIGVRSDTLLGDASMTGEFLSLGSAVCWAIATVINNGAKLPFGAWTLIFWQMLIGALALLVIARATGEHWPVAVTATQWAWFLWLSCPSSSWVRS